MDTKIKVSVIMPMLNSIEYLKECLDSVVNQTLREMEILCVDAGSTDGTLDLLADYARQDDRITILHSDKKSYGCQVNMGLDRARGEYFAIVESDDYLESDMYEVLYQLAKEHDCDVVKCDFCRFVHENGQRKFMYSPISPIDDLYGKVVYPQKDLRAFRANVMCQPALYRMELMQRNHIRLNETPGASYQDNGLWFQVFSLAERVYFHHKAYYMLRRDNPNSSIYNKGKVYMMCEEYDFIRNFLKTKPELEKRLAPLCAYFRYVNYLWNLNRIGDEFKLEFLHRFSEDYKKIEEAGELDTQLYRQEQLDTLRRVMDDPERFYYTEIYSLNRNVTTLDEVILQNRALFYRLEAATKRIEELEKGMHKNMAGNRSIGYYAEKCLWAYRTHGIRYTIKKAWEHTFGNRGDTLTADSAAHKGYDYYKSLPPEKYPEELKLWFKEKTGHELNLEAPRTFNEKLQWLKLYDSTPLKTRLADKYLVREWIAAKMGEEYLVPLLGVWDHFDDIDFDQLPAQFVLKANHGSGWNIIVKDKSQFDKADAKKKFDSWLHTCYAFRNGFELQYLNIPPKIIAEQYIEQGDQVYDYKFMCFNGTVGFIWVDTDRFTDHKRAFFDTSWNRLNIRIFKNVDYEIPKPVNFEKMMRFAEQLSQESALVRVDFYEVGEKLYFGEMTFTSGSGIVFPDPISYAEKCGQMIQLPPRQPIPERCAEWETWYR